MNEDVAENIRSRLERLRRLSTMITDKRAIEVLKEMALEAEQDIERLEQRSRGSKSGS